MANLSNTATANQVAFGQLGAVYTTTGSDAIKPPTGKVFVAITMLSNVTFDSSGGLVSETATKYFNTVDSAGDQDDGSETSEEGSGGMTVSSSVTFPQGITIHGRWTEIDVATGAIVGYIG